MSVAKGEVWGGGQPSENQISMVFRLVRILLFSIHNDPIPPSSPPLFHISGHQSFSNNRTLNDFVGNIVHSSILVPYHGWRVSHRTHHSNHGHVENDESWHPVSKKLFDGMDGWARAGRLSLPWAMFAYPFYLWKRSPGKEGSHFDPACDLFTESEGGMVSEMMV